MAKDTVSKLRANKADAVMAVRQELDDIAEGGEKKATGLLYRTRLDAAHAVMNTIMGTETLLREIRYLRWMVLAQLATLLIVLYVVVVKA